MQVYSYQSSLDLVFYIRDGVVQSIVEVECSAEVELGITNVCGAELIEIEAPATIEDGIDLVRLATEDTDELGARTREVDCR